MKNLYHEPVNLAAPKRPFLKTRNKLYIAIIILILLILLVPLYTEAGINKRLTQLGNSFHPIAYAYEEVETPTELQEIVSYITKVFEPEGKQVVVQAINCFYSESGLRPDAVGHNKDETKSTDWGVAQLNSYWHNLSEAEKTEYKANIDRAYKIYKGRGDNWSAWYGRGCK